MLRFIEFVTYVEKDIMAIVGVLYLGFGILYEDEM